LKGRINTVARLARSEFTPFLDAEWERQEWEIVRRWRADGSLNEQPNLVQQLTEPLGSGWHGRATNLGRTALQLALEALALPAQSEVALPAFACTGVVVPVLQAGLRPVLVDVDADLNISLESVTAAESPHLRAVVLPHFGGVQARDTDGIAAWATERRIAVVEDVAQAQGLARAGTVGDAAIFSFGGGKLLFGPGGGAVITRNETIAGRIGTRRLAQESRGNIDARLARFIDAFTVSRGRRSRRALRDLVVAQMATGDGAGPTADVDSFAFDPLAISPVEEALAGSKLGRIERIRAARATNAERWRDLLQSVSDLRLAPVSNNVFTKLWVAVGDASGEQARLFRRVLRRYGVETETLYTPLNLRAPFLSLRVVPLPTTQRLWRSVFALPARPGLTEADWRRIEGAAAELRSR
jgi:dTDP-4-amino-4,6-dideoxygalactose transaminase